MRCQHPLCNTKILSYMIPMHECRCKQIFCATHLQPEHHECTFDYKGIGSHELRQQLVKLVPIKVQPI